MMKYKYTIIIVSLCLIAFSIGIFSRQQKTDKSGYKQVIHSDYDVAHNLEQLKEVSDIIVKGKYVEFIDTWNMSRDPWYYVKILDYINVRNLTN